MDMPVKYNFTTGTAGEVGMLKDDSGLWVQEADYEKLRLAYVQLERAAVNVPYIKAWHERDIEQLQKKLRQFKQMMVTILNEQSEDKD